MKTTEECLDALVAGHTLVNVTGGEVWLNKFGFQESKGMGKARRGRPYAFSSPELWSIKPSQNNPTSIWSLFLYTMLLLSFGFNIAVYEAYNECQVNPQDLSAMKVSLEETTTLYETTLHKLQQYEATEESIMALGASEDQAKDIIKASKLEHVSPKF